MGKKSSRAGESDEEEEDGEVEEVEEDEVMEEEDVDEVGDLSVRWPSISRIV